MPGAKQAIESELGFQRRSWAVQRIGWLLLVAWLLSSALGALGPARSTSERVGASEQGWSAEYDRVLRLGAPTRVTLLVERKEPGELELTLAGDYVEAFELELRALEPAARAGSAGPKERRLPLAIHAAGTTRIELGLVPRELGWQTGELRIDGAPTALRHLVLP